MSVPSDRKHWKRFTLVHTRSFGFHVLSFSWCSNHAREDFVFGDFAILKRTILFKQINWLLRSHFGYLEFLTRHAVSIVSNFFLPFPEQSGPMSKYSEKCDVYSWGIILWEMLARKRPYEADFEMRDTIKIMLHVVLEQGRPRQLVGCPQELNDLIVK